MYGPKHVLRILFLVFQVSVPWIVSKITIARVKPIHIARIATLCMNEFFDPQTTSQSSYKRERLWICQHLESKSKSPRSFFVAQYVNETVDGNDYSRKFKEADVPVVGFVEIAMSSDYNRLLANYDESLSSIRIPFREQRPKISALVVDCRYRRLGIGRLLVNACALQARKWTNHDTDAMFLDVVADNTVAQSFYRSLGFVSCPSPGPMTGDNNINHRHVGMSVAANNQAKAAAASAAALTKVIIMYRTMNRDELR